MALSLNCIKNHWAYRLYRSNGYLLSLHLATRTASFTSNNLSPCVLKIPLYCWCCYCYYL